MMLTTLNISSQAVKYLVARGTSIVNWGSLPLADILHNGVIRNPSLAGERIKSLFASRELPRDRVVCSLNGLPFAYRLVPLPRIERSSLDEAAMRVAGREMPLPPGDMYLSWQAYPDGRDEWECLLLGVARPPVDSLIRALSIAGIRPYLLDIRHLLLAGLAGRRDAILVDFEPDFSAITLVVAGIPVGMHTVLSLGPAAQLQDEVDQLIDEIARMVGFYNGGHPQSPIPETAELLLTGELSTDMSVAATISSQTGYRVGPLEPQLDIPPGLPVAEYAANIGAVLKIGASDGKAGAGAPPFRNFNLARIIRERRPGLKASAIVRTWLLPVVLAAALVLLTVALRFQHQSASSVAGLRSELALANHELNQSLVGLDQAGQIETEIDNLTASAQALRQKNQRILAPEEFVDDLSRLTRSMPAGLSFSSIDMPAGRIVVTGTASSPFPVVSFVRNLEASGAFQRADIEWIKGAASGGSGVFANGVSFLVIITK
jgi:Tfp pilus assembly PilM family ATPase/Tfp pilus assembly protein PilN